PPLHRELILAAVRACPLDLREPAQERLVGVLLDQLAALPVAPLRLPLPTDPRARRVADALLVDPADGATVDQLARRVGTSRRTVVRLLRAERRRASGLWRPRR